MSTRIRMAMVGGGAGAFFGPVHRIAARLDGRFDLVAGAFSSRPEAAAQAGAELDDPKRSYANYQDMITAESQRPDGARLVAIVTPNHFHYPVARACLEAGLAVLCEKPLSINLDQARHLLQLARAGNLLFAVAYTYAGYPMVREASAMVRAGQLGTIRGAQIRYAQDWLAARAEDTGSKQATWRVDPALAGPGGCLGDIGTHCFNLLHNVTGLRALSLSADLRHLVAGRALDDEIQVALRLEGGATAGIYASQVALGEAKNGLTMHIYGDQGGLEWAQENPDLLRFTPLNEATRILRRGTPGLAAITQAATRLPGGHPEGYFEALAQLYRDIADGWNDRAQAGLHATSVADGAAGIAFVEACVASSARDGAWTKIETLA